MTRAFLQTRHRENIANGKSSIPVALDDHGIPAAFTEAAEMVSELVAVPPAVIFVWAGLKLQVIPAGRPVQLKVTVPASPDFETICKATGAEVEPLETLRLRVERASVICGEFA